MGGRWAASTIGWSTTPSVQRSSGEETGVLVGQDVGESRAGGEFSTLAGQPRSFVGRLNANGTPEPGFAPNVSTTRDDDDPSVDSVVLQADGKVLVGGFFSVLNGQSRHSIARFDPDGTPDGGFNVRAHGGVSIRWRSRLTARL